MKLSITQVMLIISMTGVVSSLGIYAVRKSMHPEPSQRIEGVIADVNYLPSTGFGSVSQTVVRFEDGRIKTFPWINDALVFQKGKTNVITYRDEGLVSVDIK